MSREVSTSQQDDVQFDSMFSLRKPKDFKAGLASGAKSIVKGVLAGEFGRAECDERIVVRGMQAPGEPAAPPATAAAAAHRSLRTLAAHRSRLSAAGTVALVAAPAIGAHQGGLKGFAKGAAAGGWKLR
jgi:hypothetical protein